VAACEFEALYGVELAGASGDSIGQSIRKDGYTLFLISSNHTELPGFTVVARASDAPDPPWDWEEFQTLPAEEKAETYGRYFDQIFLDVSVRHQSKCPYRMVSFDHRESAQEETFGRWLRGQVVRDQRQVLSKGLFVQIPVGECAFLSNQPETTLETLTILVASENTKSVDETEIRIKVSVLGTWLETKYFGRWFSSL
jgi:hypothetical protein